VRALRHETVLVAVTCPLNQVHLDPVRFYDGQMAGHNERNIEEDSAPTAEDLQVAQGIFEALFRSYIEDGSIAIEGRDPSDIIMEFRAEVAKIVSGETELRGVRDHRDTLLAAARAEAEKRRDEIAIILYATWIEHSINGMLALAFERKGHAENVINPLMRELRLHTKASALWKLAGLRDIGADNLRLLGQVIEFRNSLVHYKWPAHDISLLEQRSLQLRDIVVRVEELIGTLFSIETDTFWIGRETEIIGHFREDAARRRRDLAQHSCEATDEPDS
jgi:hypothetical protein